LARVKPFHKRVPAGAADACTESPSRVSTAMTVGATNDTDTMSSFSNYGSCVKIFAPGPGARWEEAVGGGSCPCE